MPTPPPDDDAIGLLLASAHLQARRALDEALAPLGIEARHQGVLAALDRHGPTSQRGLSELLGLDKSAMVRIMDELERLGLATRNRAAHDRRAYAIELTPEGLDKARAGGRATAEVAGRLFGWLGPEDRERLVAALTEILRRSSKRSRRSVEE